MSTINIILTNTECMMLRKAIYAERDKCFDRMNEMSNERIRRIKRDEWTKEMQDEFSEWHEREAVEKDKWNHLLTLLVLANMTGTNPFLKE